MKISKKAIIKHLLLPVVFGIVIGNFLTIFFDWRQIFSLETFLQQSFYGSILSLLFWKGNEFIIHYLNKKGSWLVNTRKRLFMHATLTFSYSLIIIVLFYFYVWFILMHRRNLTGFYDSFKVGMYICLSINFIVTLFCYSYYFYKYWKESVLNTEKLKRESLALQYESLKNQVNPHFLFNSLNTLTTLIEKDTNASINYVKQLSEVFRYVLDQNAREMVAAETELKFIDSYKFLHKIRYGNNFNLQIHIEDTNFSIVPMTLQILIENAVKHNEISEEKPLTIEVTDNGEYLIVKNNIQKRNYLPDSNYVGIKSLQFQYGYLSGKNIEILNDEKTFQVKIPKLK